MKLTNQEIEYAKEEIKSAMLMNEHTIRDLEIVVTRTPRDNMLYSNLTEALYRARELQLNLSSAWTNAYVLGNTQPTPGK